jgi:hypothetical protein
VSLLFGFETVPSWHDWTIGTHGLIIDFFGECPPLCPCIKHPTLRMHVLHPLQAHAQCLTLLLLAGASAFLS